jgi:hypothetical protein
MCYGFLRSYYSTDDQNTIMKEGKRREAGRPDGLYLVWFPSCLNRACFSDAFVYIPQEQRTMPDMQGTWNDNRLFYRYHVERLFTSY